MAIEEAENIETEYAETAGTQYPDEVQERLRVCRERRASALDLSGLGIESVPEEVKDLKRLSYLNLSENNLTEVPNFIGGLNRLVHLNLSFNRLNTLPETIGELGSLKTLNIRSNNISTLTELIGKLDALKSLDISYNRLSALPQTIDKLPSLERCEIRGNDLRNVPEKISLLTKPQSLSLLGHIEQVVNIISQNGLSDASLLSALPHSEYIACKLHITPVQGVLFSGILSDEGEMSLEELARKLNCSLIKILQYMEDINILKSKRLIRSSRAHYRDNRICYTIPSEITDFLFKDQEYIPEKWANLSLEELFPLVWKLFNKRIEKHEISYEELGIELESLLDDNSHLPFIKKIKDYNLSCDDMIMLLRFCSYLVNLDEAEMNFDVLEDVYDDISDFTFHKKKLKQGKHALIVKELIENSGGDGFRDAGSFRLTDTAKHELLSELHLSSNLKGKDIIPAAKILEKRLFYNDKEGEQVQRVCSFLEKDPLRKVQERLADSGMRTGFACLFWGPPGTGKTETVYQIARQEKQKRPTKSPGKQGAIL